MKLSAALFLLFAVGQASGFCPGRPRSFTSKSVKGTWSQLKADSGENADRPKSSRLEGNQREPTDEELKIMDDMITKLANAPAYELPNAVRRAFRVCSSPRFFVRIAERADQAVGDEKEKYSALASNLVATLEAVVSTTEDQLDERAKEVEAVLKAAAEPDSGEFLVPLLPERVEAMRQALLAVEPNLLDEGFLSTLDSWMNKSHLDGMDGMVEILQKVLQLYAGIQVSRSRAQQETTSNSPANELLETLLKVDSDAWDTAIKAGLTEEITPSELLTEVQRTMENVVLGLESGSMAQRVQAEFLTELNKRVEAFQK